jgi:WD40 repeat protein
MVTGSWDKTLRLWDLETGVVLKKMEGHSSRVYALAVSRDGQIIAGGDEKGEIIGQHGETGESSPNSSNLLTPIESGRLIFLRMVPCWLLQLVQMTR